MKPLPFVAALLLVAFVPTETHAGWRIGAAAIDVTPGFPVRLSGFGFRRAESEGVTHKIWAKALAIDDGQNGPAVLITVDNLGVPWPMVETAAGRLRAKTGLAPERFAVTATHTHTAPMLSGVAPTLFGQPIPAAHQQRIDRYTEQLTGWIEQAALEAMSDLQPGRLEWSPGSAGQVGFAKNRRAKGGPVDHDLPVLIARTANGGIRAIYTSYACHCVTLSHNKISGDWAGYAQEWLQKNHPGTVALVSIGCGADQNPDTGVTGDNTAAASAQGRQIADEVARRLKGALTPITGRLNTTLGQVALAFGTPPAKAEWERLAKRTDAVGYHARVQLARLARNETLQTRLDYPIQSWRFGDELAILFLPGEVVVDYSLRLKREFDRDRLWINAYANDAPCYIPSERILREGGYEGAGAMVYYDRPTKLAAGLEDKIVGEIQRQLPATFQPEKGTEGTKPKHRRRRCVRFASAPVCGSSWSPPSRWSSTRSRLTSARTAKRGSSRCTTIRWACAEATSQVVGLFFWTIPIGMAYPTSGRCSSMACRSRPASPLGARAFWFAPRRTFSTPRTPTATGVRTSGALCFPALPRPIIRRG